MATKQKKVAVSVTITRLHKLTGTGSGSTKAFADVEYCGMRIKGFRVVQGEKGLFVSFPQEVGKDGRWYNTIYTENKDLRDVFSKAILAAYNAPVKKAVAVPVKA